MYFIIIKRNDKHVNTNKHANKKHVTLSTQNSSTRTHSKQPAKISWTKTSEPQEDY